MARYHRQSLWLLFLFGLACLSTRAEDPAPTTLEIRSESGKPVSLTSKEFAKLPRTKADVKGKAEKVLTYEGVALAEALRSAGVSFEEHPKGRASSYLLVEGADGYRVVLALAEVDPKVTDKVVLIADRLDGKPLPADVGPYRLVVPGDKLPVRSVKQVVRISVQRPSESGKDKK